MENNPVINLFDLERAELEEYFVKLGERTFRASQIMKWIYQRGINDFDVMTNVSKSLRDKLKQCATIEVPETVSDQVSLDGSRKWLLKLADGNCIEAVYIPEEGRGTLCVSSQVGCALNPRE